MTTPETSQDKAAPREESSEFRSARRKKIFAGLAFGLVIIMVLALTNFVDNRPGSREVPDTLPASSVMGFWTSFCPAHNTIVADADAVNPQKNEDTQKYLSRLSTTLERQAADFRDAALTLNTSSVMMRGSEKQKKALQSLVDILREGDKVFSERAKLLRTQPIRSQAQMDELAAVLKDIYDRYSKAVTKATGSIGMGDGKTRAKIEKLSECKQLMVQPTEQQKQQQKPSGDATTATSTVTPAA